MAKQTINRGTTAGDKTGESLFSAFGKANDNFTELYGAKTEFVANEAALPASGEAGKIYVASDTGAMYRWGGSAYVEIGLRLSTDANGSTVIVGAGQNYAAIPVDNNGKAIVVGGGGHLRDTNAARGGLGDILLAFTGAPDVGSVSASQITDYSELCPDPEYGSYICKINGTATPGQTVYQYTPPSAVSMAGVASIGFWARAPVRPSGEYGAPIKLMLAQTAWTRYGQAQATVIADGEWHYYVIPMDQFTAFGGWLPTDDIVVFRWREGDTAKTARTVLATTESVYLSSIRKNPRGKAVGLIRFDDNLSSLMNAVSCPAFDGSATSGVSFAAGNYSAKDILDLFGFKGNAYILTDTVGQTGFATAADLLALQDHGWDICFQAKANPIGLANSGVRLLGPLGYNLVPIGGVASVDTTLNAITCSAQHGVLTVSSGDTRQGFPVEFIGTDLPAPLVASTKYWLSDYNSPTSTIFRVHTTEAGSVNGTDIVDLTTAGTAANFGVRYWGSANDYTAILNEYTQGRADMIAYGFNGYDHYALNQGAFDIYSEQAAVEVGFKTAMATVTGVTTTLCVPIFNQVANNNSTINTSAFGAMGVSPAPWINLPVGLGTEGSNNEAVIRAAVREAIALGGLICNVHHSISFGTCPYLYYYLDELKMQYDRGLIDVMTITEFQKRVEASV